MAGGHPPDMSMEWGGNSYKALPTWDNNTCLSQVEIPQVRYGCLEATKHVNT